MNDHHYAVAVGINRYPEFRDLSNARSDAEDFYGWLIDPEGGAVPERNAALIVVPDNQMPNGTPRKDARPIRTQIEDALLDMRLLCEQRVQEDPANWLETRLYFFASGHGIAPVPEEAAILMGDASPDHYGNSFSCSRYISFFQESQFFKELVFFADCCRERASNAPLLGPSWTKTENQNGQLLTIRGYATHFGELAFEEDEEAIDANPDDLRGYFTKALLEGLGGQAADPETREINSVSLGNFVTARVQAQTSHLPRSQQPFIGLEPVSPPIVFRRDIPVPVIVEALSQTFRLLFPGGIAGMVELFDGDLNRIETHDIGDGPWAISVPNGIYRIALEDGTSPFRDHGFFEVIGEGDDVQL